MPDLELHELTPAFGAEVVGFDLELLADERSVRTLRQAFDQRGALVFRDCDLDQSQQTAVADSLIGYDRPADNSLPKEMLVSNKEPEAYAPYGRLMFHSDMMWHPEPFQVLSLYGVELEPPVVSTSLASTVHAWATLPSDLRERLEGLHAKHITGQVYSRGGAELAEIRREHAQSTVSSAALTHPRTGQILLYVCQQMTEAIVELPARESEALLETLFAHLYAPDVVYEHLWREGDLVAWDNQSVQHARGKVTQAGPRRTLRKVISPIPSIAGTAENPRFTST
jgi:alpha-ketoglutarate-dependent taurine dioxygenase